VKIVGFWNRELTQIYRTNLETLTLSMLHTGKEKTRYLVYFPGSSGGVEISEESYSKLFDQLYILEEELTDGS